MYYEHLRNMLSPLRLYDMENVFGRAELEVLGEQLDSIYQALELLEREMCPATALSYGLSAYEEMLPYVPASDTAQQRQNAVSALLRIDDTCFTLSAMSKNLAGCGIDAAVCEGDAIQTAVVSFPGVRGKPANIIELQKRIEQILPCHIAVEYAFAYVTWQELEQLFQSWQELELDGVTWEELESLQAE